ncbi:MAG: glycosyltransferase family 4 protein [Nitrospirales bacterium]
MSPENLPHVLVVSNHWEAQEKIISFAGVFVDNQVASLQQAGVKVSTFDIGFSHSPFSLLKKWFQLRKVVQKFNPHLIHAQYGAIVAILSIYWGKPLVLTFIGPDLLKRSLSSAPRTFLAHLLSNLAALCAKGIICVSEELRQALWWKKNKAVVIPHGVNLDLFTAGSQIDARKELGWDLKIPVVMLSVRNDPKGKGLDLATSAMKVVWATLPNVELQIITNVSHTMMPLYYRGADVLLCASTTEGSPNVVKEALACNLPVVSVPVGDVPERLAGVYPSAVVSRDSTLIGEALLEILLKRKRSNGRENVGHLSLDQIAQQVIDVYFSALGTKVE